MASFRNVLSLVLLAAFFGSVSANEQITFYHPDALGSPVFTTNMAGEVLWHVSYEAYGYPSVSGNEPGLIDAAKNSYAGHAYDDETGLVYMQGRHYSPRLGRFLSMDPKPVDSSNPYSFNRYAYASNNPFSFIDPTGEDSFLVSRPVSGIAGWLFGKRHNFVVSHADYIGDDQANVWSFGRNSYGYTGRVDSSTIGMSAGTHGEDQVFWQGLRGLAGDDPEKLTQLSVPDDVVADSAKRLLENTRYMIVPLGEGTNSNSAASAIADRAQGSPVTVPDGENGGNSPGFDKANKIEFMEPQAVGIFH